MSFRERCTNSILNNPNFLNDAAQGFINCEMWDEAVQIIRDALKEVTNEQLVSALNKKLVDCFESLNMFSEAYDVAAGMFINHNSHELYLKELYGMEFIAGFTEGGVPYGLFNEEEKIYMAEKLDNPYEPDDELPF